MIWLLLAILVALALYPVLSTIAKILTSKRNLDFYRQQGALVYFNAKLGFGGLFQKYHQANLKVSNYEYLKVLTQNEAKGKFIVANVPASANCAVFFYDAKYVRDFVLKEESFIKKPLAPEIVDMLGLFFSNGDKAMHMRGIFSKVFSYEGMNAFVPAIISILKSTFEDFTKSQKIASEKWTEVDLNELTEIIFKRFGNLFISGHSSGDLEPEMKELWHHMSSAVDNVFALRTNIFFNLIPKIGRSLNLIRQLPAIRGHVAEQKRIMQLYLDKQAKDSGHQSACFLDRVISHNKQCEKDNNENDRLSISDIVGNFNIFLFAGTDTSKNLTKMSICRMANRPDIQKFLFSAQAEVYDQYGMTTDAILQSSAKLDLWMKEALRMHPPVKQTLFRLPTKDIKIADVTVRKGDFVFFAIDALNKDPAAFENPDTFDLTRFEAEKEKKLPKYQFMPFSIGRRMCLGKALGELMVKLTMTYFVRYFEVQKPENVEYYELSTITNTVINPVVLVKTRPSKP